MGKINDVKRIRRYKHGQDSGHLWTNKILQNNNFKENSYFSNSIHSTDGEIIQKKKQKKISIYTLSQVQMRR